MASQQQGSHSLNKCNSLLEKQAHFEGIQIRPSGKILPRYVTSAELLALEPITPKTAN